MRIEILAGGGGSIGVLREDLNDMHAQLCQTIDSYSKRIKKLKNIPCGVHSNLQDALDGLNARKSTDEKKKVEVRELGQGLKQFADDTVQTDKTVAKKLSQNSKEFYKLFPHLQADVSMEKTWWDNLVDGWNDFWGSVGDALLNAWKGIVDWYNEHPFISRIAVGIAAVAAGAIIALVTVGTALPFLIGAGIILAASTVIGAVAGGITGGASGILRGAADGFMFGGVAALSGAIIGLTSLSGGLAVIADGTLAGSIGGAISGGLSTGTSEGFWGGLFAGAVSGLIFSTVSVKLGNSIKMNLKKINNPHPGMPYTHSRPSYWKSFTLPHNKEYHAGHKWGEEYKWMKSDYLNGYVSKKQLIREYNNENHYYPTPEEALHNMSHVGESKEPILKLMFPSLTNGVNTLSFPVVISVLGNSIGFNLSKLFVCTEQ